MRPHFLFILSIVAGAILPFSIAPFTHWWLAFICLAILAFTLHHSTSKKQCFLHSFLFGLGYFGTGVSWVFVSIYNYGSASLPLALVLTSLFVSFVAFVFALPFSLLAYFKKDFWRLLLGFPLLWVFSEWLRTWLFTGFPWLFAGYSQFDSPLIGWAPVGGVLLISLFCAFSGSVLCALLNKKISAKVKLLSVIAVAMFWSEGKALKTLEWTEVAGERLTVGIVQPNIPQELKWDPSFRQPTVEILTELSQELWQKDWVIWPEAAIPDVYSRAEELINALDQKSQQSNTSLFTGVLTDDYEKNKYFNSIIGLGDAQGQYHKQRLVPFGEYVPLESWLRGLIAFFNLPTSIISSGNSQQALIQAGNYRLASSICYEIVYPALVARLSKDSHAILTISNDAWFGNSIGPLQHFHMARMRALETGRYVIRATNNGVSAIISPQGEITLQSEQFIRTNLSGTIEPMRGNTPYILMRNYLVLGLIFLMASGLIAVNPQLLKKFKARNDADPPTNPTA